MNNLEVITPIVRSLIEDEEKAVTDIFVYNGYSASFTLTETNPLNVSSVLVNDTESGVTYTEDLTKGKVNLTSSLVIDDVVQIDYSTYSNYSDSELYKYIKSALVHLSVNNVGTYVVEDLNIYPEPSDREVNLIAMIASLIINPSNISYRLPDVSVNLPKDLPTSDKIRKVIATYKRNSSIGEMFVAEDLDIE